jgi:hypothetical protein
MQHLALADGAVREQNFSGEVAAPVKRLATPELVKLAIFDLR